jgi:outer membrane immunogenic protein
MVAGVEADINYADFSADSAWPGPIYLTSSLDWFGTVRARLGVTVHDNWLVYATGGLAYADVSHRLVDPAPPLGPAPFVQTNSGSATGWTVGGGIEFLRTERWLLRAEALYVDLGSETHTYTITACGGGCTDTARWEDSFWVARLGLSLKLGERERYVPLK